MTITIAAMLAVAAGLPIQDAGQDAGQDAAQANPRIRSVILFGDEPCPEASSPDELVVCSHSGESPYRIPEEFRQSEPRPANTSWVRRVEIIEEVNRAGLPNSCSPIGTGGQTGCTQDQLRRWREEQREEAERRSRVP